MSGTPVTRRPEAPDASRARVARRRRDRALAVVGGVAAAVAVWGAFRAAGVEPMIPVGSERELQALGPGPVLTVSLGSGLAGWALAAVLERFAGRSRTVWTATALAVFVLSLLPVLTVEGTAEKIALWSMHAAVAAVVVPGVRRTLSERARR